jgi:hypothetical protein
VRCDRPDRAKVEAQSFAQRCRALEGRFGPGRHLDDGYVPGPLSGRVAPRPAVS